MSRSSRTKSERNDVRGGSSNYSTTVGDMTVSAVETPDVGRKKDGSRERSKRRPWEDSGDCGPGWVVGVSTSPRVGRGQLMTGTTGANGIFSELPYAPHMHTHTHDQFRDVASEEALTSNKTEVEQLIQTRQPGRGRADRPSRRTPSNEWRRIYGGGPVSARGRWINSAELPSSVSLNLNGHSTLWVESKQGMSLPKRTRLACERQISILQPLTTRLALAFYAFFRTDKATLPGRS